ncbi:uncharacterized protein [Coffea arabica]|uniref:Uncharacterized protein isoform X1 n=2 Tax=Coffea arabica TaxID=13443 RepID=A0ABM4VVQ0_COFAR
MMARLLWMYSVSVTSLSDLYRKGLSGASTQLSYFSSKRKKKIQVRCQRKIWLSCRQCIRSLHLLEKVLSCGLAALPLLNKFQLCLQVHLHLGLEDFQRLSRENLANLAMGGSRNKITFGQGKDALCVSSSMHCTNHFIKLSISIFFPFHTNARFMH